MATVLFLPNRYLSPMIIKFPGESAARLMDRVERGEWIFSPELRQSFKNTENLVLYATDHGGVVVVYPETPLIDKIPGVKNHLTKDQYRVLQLLAQGLTTRQIAKAMGFKTRWIFKCIAEIKLRTDSSTREEAVRQLREEEEKERAALLENERCEND